MDHSTGLAPRIRGAATTGALAIASRLHSVQPQDTSSSSWGEKEGGRLRAPFAAEPVPTRVLVHDSAVVSSSGGSFDSFNGGQFIQQLLIARLFFVEPDP